MNTFYRFFAIIFAILIISCDKDYNTIGSDVIGDEHFTFDKYEVQNMNSYIKASNSVQTNNLSINALGIYNNPVFGTTKAHIVTQLELVNVNPNLGNEHEITANDSVYVYIPFYSTIDETDTNGNRTFTLDSVYGDLSKEFKLNVYENKYYLTDLDPNDNFETSQKYYSDFTPLINTSEPLCMMPSFKFNSEEIIIYKTNALNQFVNSAGVYTEDPTEYVVKERKTPGLWLNLDKDKIEQKILDAVADGKLISNNLFKQHFRGLFFEVEEIQANEGALAMLDLTKAEVVIQYRSFDVDAEGSVSTTKTKKTMKLTMGYAASGSNKSNTINIFDFSNIHSDYANALNGSLNPEKLFLKGGANGSVAYIDVFTGSDLGGNTDGTPNGIPDELDELRENNWLINDAILTFYIDQSKMSAEGVIEPLRILLFDATNNTLITDYYADITTLANTKKNKFIHGGIIEKDDVGNGIYYKIRITEHIKRLLANEDGFENIRLGLVVTESINNSAFNYLKTPFLIGSDEIKKIPQGSIINPIGTILHGTGSTDVAKKIKTSNLLYRT